MATNRYANTDIERDRLSGKRSFATTIFPSIPQSDADVFIISRQGERLDNLAFRFYGDSGLWWIIGVSNGITDSVYIQPGTKLRIPADVQFALSYINNINIER